MADPGGIIRRLVVGGASRSTSLVDTMRYDSDVTTSYSPKFLAVDKPDKENMTPVPRFEIVLLLMAVIVVLDILARRLRFPRAAALIAGGIGFAMIPGTPDIELDPDLVLAPFLPTLLMASAWFTAWGDFRADLRIILQLAVGAVAFTTLVVGVVAHLVQPALPWGACFALGAIVSPPDSVAANLADIRCCAPPQLPMLAVSA